jgi:NDP-sugar pyrophosphorylase family protein
VGNLLRYEVANLYGCQTGDNSKVGASVEIQKGARIGKRIKISSHILSTKVWLLRMALLWAIKRFI